jgi:hypothetical protein
MNISALMSLVTRALDRIRIPLFKIPGIFLICTCVRRPGFSSILTSAKVYADMNYVENNDEIVKEFTFNLINRIKLNIQDDGVCFVIIPPGEMKFQLVGGNAGGPIILNESPADSKKAPSNNNFIFAWAIIR